MSQYAVFGSPIKHSKSPKIHEAFARQLGVDLVYTAQEVKAGGLGAAIEAFQEIGGVGANITTPLKAEALSFCSSLSPDASTTGAVNTIKRQKNGTWFGDNTDGRGFLRDLERNLSWMVENKHVVVLGAGGAARGVVSVLAQSRPQSITLFNRNRERAESLVELFSNTFRITAMGYHDQTSTHSAKDALKQADLLVNATSAGLSGKLPDLEDVVMKHGPRCYDLNYGDAAKPFATWAKQHGATVVCDGLGMLVEQAAESFCLWFDKEPDTQPVIAMLREA